MEPQISQQWLSMRSGMVYANAVNLSEAMEKKTVQVMNGITVSWNEQEYELRKTTECWLTKSIGLSRRLGKNLSSEGLARACLTRVSRAAYYDNMQKEESTSTWPH